MCPFTLSLHPQSEEKPDCIERAKPASTGVIFIPSPFFLPSKQALPPFLCKQSGWHGSYKHVHNAAGTRGACEQSVQGQRESLIRVPLYQRKVCSGQVPVIHECWLLRAKQKEQEGKCKAPRRQKDWKQNENNNNCSIQLNPARAGKEQRVRRQSWKQWTSKIHISYEEELGHCWRRMERA